MTHLHFPSALFHQAVWWDGSPVHRSSAAGSGGRWCLRKSARALQRRLSEIDASRQPLRGGGEEKGEWILCSFEVTGNTKEKRKETPGLPEFSHMWPLSWSYLQLCARLAIFTVTPPGSRVSLGEVRKGSFLDRQRKLEAGGPGLSSRLQWPSAVWFCSCDLISWPSVILWKKEAMINVLQSYSKGKNQLHRGPGYNRSSEIVAVKIHTAWLLLRNLYQG